MTKSIHNLDPKLQRLERLKRREQDKEKVRRKSSSSNQYEDETHEEFLYRKYGISKIMEDGDD